MTGIGFNMITYPCSIQWGTAVSGITRLTQNVASNYRTNAGSDIVVARGNDLAETVRSGGIYDAMSAQHALNFAVLTTAADVAAYPVSDPSETLASFAATVAGSSNLRLHVDLKITNAAGETVTMPVRIQQ